MSIISVFFSLSLSTSIGTQRFGSALNNTAETGKLILQRKWEEAIKNIFRTSEESNNGEYLLYFAFSGIYYSGRSSITLP